MLIHATPLFWGTLILFILTVIFFIIDFSLLYYWHEKSITYIVVPLLHSFEFFTIAFLAMALGVLLIEFFPQLLNIFAG